MKSIRIYVLSGLVLGLVSVAKADEAWLAKFKEGRWEGRVANSVSDSLKGKTVWATSEIKPDGVWVTVKREGGKGEEKEVWKITATQLTQTEYDAAGKATATYNADWRKETDAGLTARTYDVHCSDRAAQKCDNNIDPNNSWKLKVAGSKFDYWVLGLKDKNDPKSLSERHHFEFRHLGPATAEAGAPEKE